MLAFLCQPNLRGEAIALVVNWAGEEFPHLYGPLNLDAVVEAIAFEPDANGQFQVF